MSFVLLNFWDNTSAPPTSARQLNKLTNAAGGLLAMCKVNERKNGYMLYFLGGVIGAQEKKPLDLKQETRLPRTVPA